MYTELPLKPQCLRALLGRREGPARHARGGMSGPFKIYIG
eukprot:SAG22_NODE_15963_length_336_cov_0.426160_2_plen_39_part_01